MMYDETQADPRRHKHICRHQMAAIRFRRRGDTLRPGRDRHRPDYTLTSRTGNRRGRTRRAR